MSEDAILSGQFDDMADLCRKLRVYAAAGPGDVTVTLPVAHARALARHIETAVAVTEALDEAQRQQAEVGAILERVHALKAAADGLARRAERACMAAAALSGLALILLVLP